MGFVSLFEAKARLRKFVQFDFAGPGTAYFAVDSGVIIVEFRYPVRGVRKFEMCCEASFFVALITKLRLQTY